MADDQPADITGSADEGTATQRVPVPKWEWGEASKQELVRDLTAQRYSYILQQIHVINENIYRFLAIYQGLITVLGGAQVILFVNYRRWGLDVSTTRLGLLTLLIFETAIGCFVILLMVIGALTWFDYRNEECDITDRIFGSGFRHRPTIRNWYRWYETYMIAFVLVFTALTWTLVVAVLIPRVR